jgi:hypothetical protein
MQRSLFALLLLAPRLCWGLDAVGDFKMVPDGKTDNYPSLVTALADPRIKGGMELTFPAGDYRVVMPAGVPELCRLWTGATFRGTPGVSVISIASAADEYKAPFRCADPSVKGVYFEGLTIRRASAWSGCLVALDCGTNLAFRDCAFDGGLADATINPAAGFCFGVYYAAGQSGTALRDVSFAGCTFTGCAPAVGSSNQATATVSGLHFERCRFQGDYASDLEFNAPNQTVEQERTNTVPAVRPYLQGMVRVRDCSFGGNKSPGPGGWGVGLAHVYDCSIESSTFAGYRAEAVHVEDYSTDVRLANNRFVGCAAAPPAVAGKAVTAGVVAIITASSKVTLSGNQFDQRGATAPGSACVWVLAGADPKRFSQLPSPWPSDVQVVANTMDLGAAAVGVAVIDGCQRVSATGNNFIGPSPRATQGAVAASGNVVAGGK